MRNATKARGRAPESAADFAYPPTSFSSIGKVDPMNFLKRMAKMEEWLYLAILFAVCLVPILVYAAGAGIGFW